jgi:hypothetical protein
MLEELTCHGYRISSGAYYPFLQTHHRYLEVREVRLDAAPSMSHSSQSAAGAAGRALTGAEVDR